MDMTTEESRKRDLLTRKFVEYAREIGLTDVLTTDELAQTLIIYLAGAAEGVKLLLSDLERQVKERVLH